MVRSARAYPLMAFASWYHISSSDRAYIFLPSYAGAIRYAIYATTYPVQTDNIYRWYIMSYGLPIARESPAPMVHSNSATPPQADQALGHL